MHVLCSHSDNVQWQLFPDRQVKEQVGGDMDVLLLASCKSASGNGKFRLRTATNQKLLIYFFSNDGYEAAATSTPAGLLEHMNA